MLINPKQKLNRAEIRRGCANYNVAPPPMLPYKKPGYCRVRSDNKAAPKQEACFYPKDGSPQPASSFKVKLQSGVVVYTCDVTRGHPREASAIPQPAEGGGSSKHPPFRTGIDAAYTTATTATL